MTSFDFSIAEDGQTVVVTGEGDAPAVTSFLLPDGLMVDDDAILRIGLRDFGTLLIEGEGWSMEVSVPPEVADWLLDETLKDRGMADG